MANCMNINHDLKSAEVYQGNVLNHVQGRNFSFLQGKGEKGDDLFYV